MAAFTITYTTSSANARIGRRGAVLGVIDLRFGTFVAERSAPRPLWRRFSADFVAFVGLLPDLSRAAGRARRRSEEKAWAMLFRALTGVGDGPTSAGQRV